MQEYHKAIWALWLEAQTHLIHNIPKLLLDLLLRALEPLPQIIPHTAPLQQNLQRLLRIPDLNDSVDILCCAAQQSSLQNAVWHLGLLHVKQGEVDIALEVGGEPGLKGRGVGGLSFAVETCEDAKRASKYTDVGDGHGEHKPVDEVEGPHFGYQVLGEGAWTMATMAMCSAGETRCKKRQALGDDVLKERRCPQK